MQGIKMTNRRMLGIKVADDDGGDREHRGEGRAKYRGRRWGTSMRLSGMEWGHRGRVVRTGSMVAIFSDASYAVVTGATCTARTSADRFCPDRTDLPESAGHSTYSSSWATASRSAAERCLAPQPPRVHRERRERRTRRAGRLWGHAEAVNRVKQRQ